MANEIIASIQFRTDDKALDTTESKLADIEESLKNINDPNALGSVTREFEEMNNVVETSSLSFSEMGKAVEQYQTIALKAGSESPVGRAAIKKAAELKDQMDRVTTSVDVLSKKGVALQGALQMGATVTAGYGAFIGITELAGAKSEEFEKSMKKLMAVQTTLSSIEQIRLALAKESIIVMKAQQLWSKLTAVSEAILTKTRIAQTGATVGSTLATKALTIALAATGIGLLIVGIGLLIANFDKMKGSIMSVVDTIKEWFQPTIDLAVDALQFMGLVESDAAEKSRLASEKKANAARQAAKEYVEAIEAEEEALRKTTEAKVRLIDADIMKLQAAGKDTTELEKDKIELYIETTKKEIELSEKRNAARIKELEVIAKMTGFVGDMARERLKEIEEEGLALTQQLEDYELQLEVHEIKKQASFDSEAYRQKKELENYRIKADGLVEIERKNAELITEIRSGLAKEQMQTNDELLASYLKTQKEIDDNRMSMDLKSASQRIGLAKDSFAALADLSESFNTTNEAAAKRQFKITKAFNLSAAIVNTAQAVTGALAEPSVIPGERFVKAGIAATTGAAAILRISQSKFQGGGGDSGAAGAISSIVSNVSGGFGEGSNGTQSTTTGDFQTPGQGGGGQPVLVVDSLLKVSNMQTKIEAAGTI